MTKLKLYQVDAFAERLFEGNPAAVCPLAQWLPDDVMQSIAQENNLSETAFFVSNTEGYQIRWFTPKAEVNLCGHATLASAYVIFNLLEPTVKAITFQSKSGNLHITRHGETILMDFPAQAPTRCAPPPSLTKAFGSALNASFKAEDYLVIMDNEMAVIEAKPDMELLRQLDGRGVIITAPGQDYDFVSRFFAPKLGVDEDPVTGSAHTQLVPYWSRELSTDKLIAKQLSQRGGILQCQMQNKRVLIGGKAVLYLCAEMEL